MKTESEIVEQMKGTLPKLCETANNCVVWDADSYNQAADLAKFISEAVKTMEAERKRITAPLNESLKATNSLFQKLSDPLNVALSVTKGKILRFRLEEESRAKEKLEKRKAESPESAGSLEALAAVPTTAARGGFGSVGVMKRWTFRVKDKAVVPVEMMEVDSKKVNEAIRSGVREIPGIDIFQEETAVVR